ncbi:MAG: aromatic acid decarboxylase [Candidatus Aquicultor secundus]|uniref:Flavin prenyltransferase UbiX n=1 Tax=Candidatus Aquicultor secundus TaxID=1973895 RepID=A0A2M7T605_9ACTN|nr:flavin prenyltransferase UbiX [Candidatus Aquicultor secundus]NCO65756.1 UbiX family flavin prenyltransferase [Solirubrobacter sp.]OIO84883.1 MAG: aromatic acid decarboxylase [Candidatus Aquicultor secundus]PIU26492.1 MAG: aromatic acid decarboxylase [Candidatus Aquicultor secundus]PIW21537.1 MAG: aromatic acid decarboxylase [Candidatus Aquicultor secundus]PIX52634.1 MAG: aromatic acid decarboxylase [Candidatus Aquicultor secundus]
MGSNLEYVVAITGASGVVYGKRLIQELLRKDFNVSLIISNPGKLVITHELGFSFNEDNAVAEMAEWLEASNAAARLSYYRDDDLMAPMCSGSHFTGGMVIIPCTMATLGAIAGGLSSSLIERSADVALKESRRLVIVPRETPFNRIHLKNLLEAEGAGAKIVPAMPAFYNNPKTIEDLVDFVVGKVLDQLGVEHTLFERWQGE